MTEKFRDTMIVSDMDGTFLSKEARPVEENLKAIRYFVDNGGVFTLATGRCFSVLDLIFPTASEFVNAPAILCNGGYLFDVKSRKIQNARTLDKSETIAILEKVQEKFPHIGYRISSECGIIIPNKTEYMFKRFQNVDAASIYQAYTDLLDADWHKVVFCACKESIAELLEFFSHYPLEHLKFTPSSSDLLEFIPRQSGKGSKVNELRELFPNRTLYGVGDFDNDIDLLQAVDIAACPANANEAVKNLSTFHLCHHDQGCIADLIYQLDSIKSK